MNENRNNEDLMYNLFCSESEQPNVVSDCEEEHEFQYTMPKIFEDDEKCGEDVNTLISFVVENICLKKIGCFISNQVFQNSW